MNFDYFRHKNCSWIFPYKKLFQKIFQVDNCIIMRLHNFSIFLFTSWSQSRLILESFMSWPWSWFVFSNYGWSWLWSWLTFPSSAWSWLWLVLLIVSRVIVIATVMKPWFFGSFFLVLLMKYILYRFEEKYLEDEWGERIEFLQLDSY